MGQQQTQFGKYVGGQQTPGESRILRNFHTGDRDQLTKDFQGMDNIKDIHIKNYQNFPHKDILGTRTQTKKEDGTIEFGEYQWMKYKDFYENSERLGKFIVHHNLCPKISSDDGNFGMIGLYAKNREEWIVTDFAAVLAGIATVTLYDTLGKEFIEYIINQTQLNTLVLQSDKIKKILELKEAQKINLLNNLIVLDQISQEDNEKAKALNLTVYSYDDIQKDKTDFSEVQFEKVTGDTVYTICYTSGTTGNPKGAMMTHQNFICQVQGLDEFDPNFKFLDTDSYISYLPLSHAFERCLMLCIVLRSIKYGFYSGDVQKLSLDLQVLRPTILISVPRLLTRFNDVINQRVREQTGFKKTMIEWGISSKVSNVENKGQYTHAFYDRVIFNKFTALLGGNVRLMITGSAPIEKSVLIFLQACFCCPILNGYGQTEGAAPTTVAWIGDPELGHAGPPFPSNELKVVDVPDMNYLSTDKDENGNDAPRGEVWYRGNNVFKGYYQLKETTNDTVDKEGWVHSGDIGQIIPGGKLRIIDRKKNIFKLSQGEYVLPDRLENKFIQSPYIFQIFVYGDSLQNYLVAIVVPEKTEIEKWVKQKEIAYEKYDDLLKNKDVVKLIQDEIRTIGRASQFVGYEIPSKIHLTNIIFTEDNNLLTTTQKFKRFEAKNFFMSVIKDLYDGAKLMGE